MRTGEWPPAPESANLRLPQALTTRLLDRGVYGGRVKPKAEEGPRRCWPCRRCGDPPGPGDWQDVTCPTHESGQPHKHGHVTVGAPQPVYGLAPLTAHDAHTIWLSPRGLRDEQQEARDALLWEEAQWRRAEERAAEAAKRFAEVESRVAALKAPAVEKLLAARNQRPASAGAEPKKPAKPGRPSWLAHRPDWVKKPMMYEKELRLPNGQLARDFGDGVLGYLAKNGTYNFVKDHRKPKPPPSTKARSRSAPSEAGSERSRPGSAPSRAGTGSSWPVASDALALEERLKELERRADLASDPGSDVSDRFGRPRAKISSGKMYIGGAPWQPGANSMVDVRASGVPNGPALIAVS